MEGELKLKKLFPIKILMLMLMFILALVGVIGTITVY